MQKEEYLIKNACYSVTKYYLCKRNNKRSLSGRKQRLEVVRSFPNRYQFSCINKVTSLFSNRYIFIIILTLQLVCSTTAKSMHHLCSGKSLIVRYGSSSSSCLLQSFHILSSSLFVLSFDRWQYNLSFPARFISWNFHIFVSISMLHKCVREECIRQ